MKRKLITTAIHLALLSLMLPVATRTLAQSEPTPANPPTTNPDSTKATSTDKPVQRQKMRSTTKEQRLAAAARNADRKIRAHKSGKPMNQNGGQQ